MLNEGLGANNCNECMWTTAGGLPQSVPLIGSFSGTVAQHLMTTMEFL